MDGSEVEKLWQAKKDKIIVAVSKESQLVEHLPRFIAEQALPLAEAGIEYAKGEVEMILCYLLEIDRLRLYLDGKRLITEDHLKQLKTIIEKRSTRYPLQYILEESWFYGRRFFVSEAVMVPTPETEVLIEAAKRFVARKGYDCCRILDIGVGSGVISITMAAELNRAPLMYMSPLIDTFHGSHTVPLLTVAALSRLVVGALERYTVAEVLRRMLPTLAVAVIL